MRQTFLFFLFRGLANLTNSLDGLHQSGAVLYLTYRFSWASQTHTVPFKAAINSMAKPRQFLGVTALKWLEYLVAILIGNAIYYLSLAPHLPDALRHQGFQIDGGVLVDFAVCVGVYGLIRLGIRLNVGFL